MAGRSEMALRAARAATENVGSGPARSGPRLEAVTAALYSTMVTFGRDDLLRERLPPPELRFTTAMAYYGRGVAFATKGREVVASRF